MKYKKSIFLSICILIANYIFAQDIISAGTEIKLKNVQNLNGSDLNEGQKIDFVLANDYIKNGKILLKSGLKAIGKVQEAEGSKILGKKGKLEFSIDELILEDNRRIKLNSDNVAKSKSRGLQTAALTVLVSPVGLLMKGQQAKFEKGTSFNAYVEEDFILNRSVIDNGQSKENNNVDFEKWKIEEEAKRKKIERETINVEIVNQYLELKSANKLNITNVNELKVLLSSAKYATRDTITKMLQNDFVFRYDSSNKPEDLEAIVSLANNFFYPGEDFRLLVHLKIDEYRTAFLNNKNIDTKTLQAIKNKINSNREEQAEYYISKGDYDKARKIYYFENNNSFYSRERVLEKIINDIDRNNKNKIRTLQAQNKIEDIIKLSLPKYEKDRFLRLMKMDESRDYEDKIKNALENFDTLSAKILIDKYCNLFTREIDGISYKLRYAKITASMNENLNLSNCISELCQFVNENGLNSFYNNMAQGTIDIIFQVIDIELKKGNYNDALSICSNVLTLLPNEENTIKLIKKIEEKKKQAIINPASTKIPKPITIKKGI